MNNQEAIKSMRNLDMVISITATEHESVKLAIEALEKQIPKKPLGIENDNRYGCVLECFECKTILSGSEERPLYCPECGQKIDWSAEE